MPVCTYRADTESTSEHLEALRKLSSDLEEQRTTLEDLRDQKQAILPQLSLLDKELVKQQVELHSCSSSAYSNIEYKHWVQFYTMFRFSSGGSSGAVLVPT